MARKSLLVFGMFVICGLMLVITSCQILGSMVANKVHSSRLYKISTNVMKDINGDIIVEQMLIASGGGANVHEIAFQKRTQGNKQQYYLTLYLEYPYADAYGRVDQLGENFDALQIQNFLIRVDDNKANTLIDNAPTFRSKNVGQYKFVKHYRKASYPIPDSVITQLSNCKTIVMQVYNDQTVWGLMTVDSTGVEKIKEFINVGK
jgi:hypothetical protein